MKTLAIDIETYSSVSLQKAGVYAYAASPDFEILLFGYAWDDGPVEVIDMAQGQKLPQELQDALYDPEILKTAFNASFERTCLSAFMGRVTPADQWSCTAVMARELGLPGSLEAVGDVIGLPEDKQKSKTGKALIRYFSIPCKATKVNGERTRNLPRHDPERWNLYVEYNRQDVVTERAIRKRLQKFPVIPSEHDLWIIDQHINDRGVGVDTVLAENAVAIDQIVKARLLDAAKELTGLDNPKSAAQLKSWIEEVSGFEVESLNKKMIGDVRSGTSNEEVHAMLDIRQGLAKTSTEKYNAMLRTVCPDGRIRGLTQFCGAARTGRWAGRLVQMQNLPQNKMPDMQIPEVREELAKANFERLKDRFDDPDEDYDWVGQLTCNKNGKFDNTINNVQLIMEHDAGLRGKYFYDTFKERMTVCGDLPWCKLADRMTTTWTDTDDAGLRNFLEIKYEIVNTMKIGDAVLLAMQSCMRHPVREYLLSLKWDGVARADTIFIDYLGAEDTEYTRTVTRKALIGAVARIMQPGCKHDHILVLVGPQGCRKSTTLAKLGKSWFSDSFYTVQGKEAYEQIQGFWLIEMGEMAATRKAELESIKQFVSKQSDSYRAAYAKRTQEHPRQCAFFGTTNDDEFLRDATGGRRFWPVTVTDKGRETGDYFTAEIVDQVWAEIVMRYSAGENWYLDNAKIEAVARQIQDAHTEMNGKQGLLEQFVERLLPKDWATRNLSQRLAYWNDGFDDEKQAGTERRKTICALEIHCELFGGTVKDYTPQKTREYNAMLKRLPGWKARSRINYGEIYGQQRGFVREESE